MKPKTRYNIKLALRHGIEVRSTGIRGLQTWYSLYTEMAIRNGLHINDIEYFRSMFAPKMDAEGTDVDVRLLIAYYEDKPLAAMFLVMSAHRATYLRHTDGQTKQVPRVRYVRNCAQRRPFASYARPLQIQARLRRRNIPPARLLGLPYRRRQIQMPRRSRNVRPRVLLVTQ